jgi:hypothetical protein
MPALDAAIRTETARFKAAGFRWVLSPSLARRTRRLALWDAAVHVEPKPIPLACRGASG